MPASCCIGPSCSLLRDSDNRTSAIRYHSLLRDLYGTEGFVAEVYSPVTLNQDFATPQSQYPRYAGVKRNSAALGVTLGQLIDIYVRQLPLGANDTLTTIDDAQAIPDTRHVLALDRDAFGLPQSHALSLTRGYYNGCVLTMTSGPAAGQSTRIVDYEYIGEGSDTSNVTTPPTKSRLFRFRVMAFQRTDGTPLQTRGQLPVTHPARLNPNNNRDYELFDLVTEARNPAGAISKRGGHTFVVNGRPFSGTGVGYNQFALPAQARLTAMELFPVSTDEALAAEVALLPNSVYFNSNPRSQYALLSPRSRAIAQLFEFVFADTDR